MWTRRGMLAASAMGAMGVPSTLRAATSTFSPRGPTTTDFGVVADGQFVEGVWRGTDDHAAWLRVVDFWKANPGVGVHHPTGVSIVSAYVPLPDQAVLTGDGPGSGVANINGSEPRQLGAPFWLGNWYIDAVGVRPRGSAEPWRRRIQLHPCARGVAKSDVSVSLANPAEADAFSAGRVYYLRSVSSSAEVLHSGLEAEVPINNTLVRIRDIDTKVGTIYFDRPAGFDDPMPPLLCAIPDDSHDAYGPIYLVQGVRIMDVSLYGACGFGSNSTGAYDCHLERIHGRVKDVIRCNGFAYSSHEYRGEFSGVAAETKFCSHDSTVKVIATSNSSGSSQDTAGVDMIAIGEYCRNVTIVALVDAPNWRGPGLISVQPGYDCHVFAKISAPRFGDGYHAVPVTFIADKMAPSRGNVVQADLVHAAGGANPVVYFGSGAPYPPRNNTVIIRSHFVGPGPPPEKSVVFAGGGGNVVSGDISKGSVVTAPGAGGQFMRGPVSFGALMPSGRPDTGAEATSR